jgi:hypothetical protein
MSAIAEDGDGFTPETVKVLFTLHPGLDALDFIGPLEVLSHARHDVKDPGKLASLFPPITCSTALVPCILEKAY